MIFPSLFSEVAIIVVVVVLWVWAVMDVLQKELSGSELAKWLVIILVLPILGFVPYFWLGRRKYKA